MKQSNTRILATEKHNLCGVIDWTVIKFSSNNFFKLSICCILCQALNFFIFSHYVVFKNIPVVHV